MSRTRKNFPTKIGTLMCNALIDTCATRSCISEKYYQNVPLTKIQYLRNISVRSATGSNLTPFGLINCSFELGKISAMACFRLLRNGYVGTIRKSYCVYSTEPVLLYFF